MVRASLTTTMLVPAKGKAAPENRTLKSSSTCQRGDNLLESISSHWDEIFEASDLVKFTRAVRAEEDAHQDHLISWGEDSASRAGTELCYSSTSSLSSKQQDCSEEQSGCKGDWSQLLYPSRLKIHAAKIALNSGKQHLSITGRVRTARHLKNPCHSSCRRCQPPRLTPSERQVVLDYFWSMKSHEKQWGFISNAVRACRPKKKFAVQGTKGEKSCSRVYSLSINGDSRRVCKTMFKNTLCICDSWIDSALSHVPKGLPDLRGKRK